jgi:prevent-host-death family protein
MKRDSWQLQHAKAQLSKLIETSATRGPQTVTRHGRPAAVVLSAEAYRRIRRRQPDFKSFLARAPLHTLELARSRDKGRKLEL